MRKLLLVLGGLVIAAMFGLDAQTNDKPAPEAKKVPVWNGHKLSRVRDKRLGHQTYYHPAKFKLAPNPGHADNRPTVSPQLDQLALGACVDNGSATLYHTRALIQKNPNAFAPSRLYAYYWARSIEGTVNEDSGSSIEDGIKALAQYGTLPEEKWPYDISKFKERPPDNLVAEAKQNAITDYGRCPDNSPQDIKASLAAGYCIEIGFDVYDNFPNDASTKGIVPMPQGQVRGGHAVDLVAYDDDGSLGHKGYYCFRNSWGSDWGDNGCGWFPQQFVHSAKYCSDFWIIASVPGGAGPTPPPPPPPPPIAQFDIGIRLKEKTVTIPSGWKAYKGSARQTWVQADPKTKTLTAPRDWRLANPQGKPTAVKWVDILIRVEKLLATYGPMAKPIIEALVDGMDLPPFIKAEIDTLLDSIATKKKAAQ